MTAPNQSRKNLLKAYAAELSSPKNAADESSAPIDPDVEMILMLTIIDYKSGEWGHDFLVREGKLPDPTTDDQRKTQVRKVQRWRSKVEALMWLPARGRGGITPIYRKKRAKWDKANPRPTDKQLLEGWQPVKVDYTEFEDEEPVPAPAPKPSIPSAPPEAPTVAPASEAKTPDPDPKPTTPDANTLGLSENKKGEVDWTDSPISVPPPKNMKQSGYRRYWDTQFIGRNSFLEVQRKRICDVIPNGKERGDILLAKIEETPKTDTTANDYATRIADLNAIYRTQPEASMGGMWLTTMIKAYLEFTDG